MPTLIRTVNPSDISELERIAEESRLSPWTQQGYIDEIMRPDSIFLLAETADNEIMGFIVGRIVPGPEAEIYNIAVSKKARRQGTGNGLLAEFISRCKALKVENIWLEVRRSNANAVKFYTDAGFEEISLRPRFYSDPVEDAIIMRLEL